MNQGSKEGNKIFEDLLKKKQNKQLTKEVVVEDKKNTQSNTTNNVEVVDSIPEGYMCVFGQKFSKGVRYFVGRRRGNEIYISFTQKKCPIDESIISYQHVLNLNNRKVK